MWRFHIFIQISRQDAVSELQEEMLGWGAARPGQVLPHRVLQMSRLSDVAGPGWILLQGRRVLLHAGLSGSLRHQVLPLRTIRRRGSGHRSGEDVPQQLLHLRPLQVIAVFLSFFPFVTQPKISFLETHKSNFGWMPSGSLTGRNTLFYISTVFRYYFVIVDAASAAVFYLLYFWGKQLKGSGQLCRIVFRRTSSCQKNRQLLLLFCLKKTIFTCRSKKKYAIGEIDRLEKISRGLFFVCDVLWLPLVFFSFFQVFFIKKGEGRNMDRIDSRGGPGKWDENLDK